MGSEVQTLRGLTPEPLRDALAFSQEQVGKAISLGSRLSANASCCASDG